MPNESDWNIKPRGLHCARCAKAFVAAEQYMSRLSFGDEGYIRADFCMNCWAAEPNNPSTVSLWRGTFQPPPPPAEEPVKKETAESLLRSLIDRADPTRANTVFILAVILERRRILIEREVRDRDDGKKIRVYEHRKTGETFVILDPMLALDQLEPVQEEVVAMLSGGQTTEEAEPRAGSEDNGRPSA